MRFDPKLLMALLPFLIISTYSLFFNAYTMDEYTYLLIGRHYAAGDFFNAPEVNRFPVFPALLAVAFKFFGESLLVARLLSILAGAAAVALVYWFGAKHFGADAGLWAALLLGSSPFFAYLSNKVLTESLFMLALFACFYLAVKAADDKKWLIALGPAFALLILTRYFGLYFGLIALIFWWRRGKLVMLSSREFVAGAIGFVAVFLPWLYYSTALTGNPLGLMAEFFLTNRHLVQGGFALTDRIPSYLLAVPFIAGAAVAIVALSLRRLLAMLSQNASFAAALSIGVIAIVMELHGFLQFRLLRYIVPAAPFVALFAGAAAAMMLKRDTKTIVPNRLVPVFLASLLIVNLAASAAVVYWLGSSPRYSAYHTVGEFVAANCPSHYSNLDRVMEFYSRKPSAATLEAADCTVVSSYDPNVLKIPYAEGRPVIFTRNGLTVYGKTRS